MNFDAAYMRKRLFISWRGSIIADALCTAVKPRTVLDLGCATGDIAKGFLDAGVEAWGVDNSSFAMSLLPYDRKIFGNLRLPPSTWTVHAGWERIETPVDLVVLLEVLSIIEPDSVTGSSAQAQRLDILDTALDLGTTLLVNRLGKQELERLAERGWERDLETTRRLRKLLRPFGSRQAIKALYLTGTIWRPVVIKPEDDLFLAVSDDADFVKEELLCVVR